MGGTVCYHHENPQPLLIIALKDVSEEIGTKLSPHISSDCIYCISYVLGWFVSRFSKKKYLTDFHSTFCADPEEGADKGTFSHFL